MNSPPEDPRFTDPGAADPQVVSASMRQDPDRWTASYTQRTATKIAAHAAAERARLNGRST